MSEIKPDVSLDLRGLFCPMPIVKLTEAIGQYEVGTFLEVLATDPGTLADIPAWASTTGNEVVDTKRESNVIKFIIKKLN